MLDSTAEKVVGTLTQRDVVRAYSAYTLYSTESNAKVQQLQEYTGDAGQFVSVLLKRLFKKGRELCGAGLRLVLDMRAHVPPIVHSARMSRLHQTPACILPQPFLNRLLKSSSPILGQTLAKLTLPREAVIVSVKRGGEVLVPHGNTVLEMGDELLAFISPLSEIDVVLAQMYGAVLL